MGIGRSALGVLQRAKVAGEMKVEGARSSLGWLGQVLPSDPRQGTYISPGRCLDLGFSALGFRDPLLDTVGQIERGAEHPHLLVSSESGGPAQPMRLPVDEMKPPKTEAVQTSGAHIDTLLLTHFLCSSSRWRGADTSPLPEACGTCGGPWRTRPEVLMVGHVIAVSHFHVFLPQSNGFFLLRRLCLEKTCLALLEAPPGLRCCRMTRRRVSLTHLLSWWGSLPGSP